MLYLIESGKHYKVGYTRDLETLEKRLKAYKTHNPDLKLLGLAYGDREEEAYYHDSRLEWMEKDEKFEDIIKDFHLKLDSLEILFYSAMGIRLYPFNKSIEEEFDTMVGPIGAGPHLFQVFAAGGELYIATLHELFVAEDAQYEPFFLDYDEYGDSYRGVIVNDKFIIYTYRGRLGEESNITTTESPLYKKIKGSLE